jgi:hypothetical protein
VQVYLRLLLVLLQLEAVVVGVLVTQVLVVKVVLAVLAVAVQVLRVAVVMVPLILVAVEAVGNEMLQLQVVVAVKALLLLAFLQRNIQEHLVEPLQFLQLGQILI